MSKLSDYLTAQEGYNSAIGSSIDGIVADVAELNRLIAELQNSPDRVTADDQARIDALQAAGATLTASAQAADDLTPPVAPPAPPA
jgi:uncharacterized small protein (DUF1192 family)